MGQLLGPDTFEFLAKFFLAGWLFLSARSWWVRGEKPRPNEVLFEAITLSLINQLIALITLPAVLGILGSRSGLLPLLLEVMAQPVLLGIGIGWLAKQNTLPDGLRRLFMPSVTPVSDSFDFAFAQIERETFLIMKFSDGRSVYGYFGSNSFANNHGEGGGVFLEALFTLDTDGLWLPVEPARSAWISLTGLTSIEMIPDEGAANGQDHL